SRLEQRNHNPCVGGSNPSFATIVFPKKAVFRSEWRELRFATVAGREKLMFGQQNLEQCHFKTLWVFRVPSQDRKFKEPSKLVSGLFVVQIQF
ncbi:hypothetical protein LXJ59_27065, partial [Escherichia coli]|nr:hypothetical protein [Escherichia coli]